MIRKGICILSALLLAACAAKPAPVSTASPSSEPIAAATAEPAESAEASAMPQETVAPTDVEPVEVTSDTAMIDYSDEKYWCYWNDGIEKSADVFLIIGTIFQAPEGNIALNEDTIEKERRFVNRMRGMTDDSCTLFAPAFRQKTLDGYVSAQTDAYSEYAYKDIREAFRYFLDHGHTAGKPIVLFGFSHGAEMVNMLMEEYFTGDSEEAVSLRNELAGAYILGWGITAEEYEKYPDLKAAQGADDTGVMISFEAERPDVVDSLTVPAGKEYVSINPLNWKTDSTRASKEENEGAVLVNGKGEIKYEEKNFCGGYLDETPRHVLKIDDINYDKYENQIAYLPVGSYHSYIITFFYRNLQKNVTERVNALLNKNS